MTYHFNLFKLHPPQKFPYTDLPVVCFTNQRDFGGSPGRPHISGPPKPEAQGRESDVLHLYLLRCWIKNICNDNLHDLQRCFFLPSGTCIVNISWEMYVFFVRFSLFQEYPVLLWSLQVFMFAAVAISSFCIHFRGSLAPADPHIPQAAWLSNHCIGESWNYNLPRLNYNIMSPMVEHCANLCSFFISERTTFGQ